MESIRQHGLVPDLFCQIVRGAREFLQEMIFKFTLPPKPMPKIDLQEWKDMQKIMSKLQKQTQEIKARQQDISVLKKQLSETTGLFKGKERKALEEKIQQTEHLVKHMHVKLEQIVKQEDYSDTQSFVKVFHKSEELIREYNEELRAWKNQSSSRKKTSVLDKLRCYQEEGKKQAQRTARKKSWDREQ